MHLFSDLQEIKKPLKIAIYRPNYAFLGNLTDILALCEEIFDHFSLFDETLRHIELCNTVSSVTYSEIRQNFSNSVSS